MFDDMSLYTDKTVAATSTALRSLFTQPLDTSGKSLHEDIVAESSNIVKSKYHKLLTVNRSLKSSPQPPAHKAIPTMQSPAVHVLLVPSTLELGSEMQVGNSARMHYSMTTGRTLSTWTFCHTEPRSLPMARANPVTLETVVV
jgi:hypothetical protein